MQEFGHGMVDGIQTYRRTLKLPCAGLAEGRPFREHLNSKIRALVMGLAAPAKGITWTPDEEESGNIAGKLTAGMYEISLRTNFGQNTAFNNGAKQTFISYGITMDSSLAALDRAEQMAENVTLALKVAGGIFGPVPFYLVIELMLKSFGHAIIPVPLVVVSILAGIWCGSKLGGMVGARLEAQALRRVESQGGSAEVDEVWRALEKQIGALTKDFEQV